MSFDYKIIYARRRSIAIKIADDNSVVVRCPYGTSVAEAERFIALKRDWLQKNMAANQAIMQEFGDVLCYRKILVGGRKLNLCVGVKNGVSADIVYVKTMSSLKAVLVKAYGSQFLSKFQQFARSNGFNYGNVCFRSYSGRWGCCDTKNNITFNYKLLMLPNELQLAVIAHELCHTLYHNHSPAFHSALKGVYPNIQMCERGLKKYSFLARMY